MKRLDIESLKRNIAYQSYQKINEIVDWINEQEENKKSPRDILKDKLAEAESSLRTFNLI